MTRVINGFLTLLAASSALAGPVESQRETPGRRFCEVAWHASAPGAGRLVLQDGESECILRSSAPADGLDHTVLVPLARGRTLAYSVLLPDGTRTQPRRLPEASDQRRGQLRARQEPAGGGSVDLLAGASTDARWSLTAQRNGKEMRLDALDAPSPSARFRIGDLGPDDRLDMAVLHARHVDFTEELPIGSILGNRRLAADFVKAVERLDLRALLARMYSKGATHDTVRAIYRERAQAAGLDAIHDAALTRLAGVLADPKLDAQGVRIPFALQAYRLASIDWLARFKGWEPISGSAAELAGTMRITHPAEPAPSAASLYLQKTPFPIVLWLWPDFIPRGPETATWARVNDPAWRQAMTEELREKLAILERAFGFRVEGVPVNWGELTIDQSLLASPDGLVTFYIDVNDMEPVYLMYLRLNEELLIPFRNTANSYKGLSMIDPLPDAWKNRAKTKANWIGCTVAARLLRPGKTTWIATAQNLLPTKVAPTVPLLREIRLAPGGPAEETR